MKSAFLALIVLTTTFVETGVAKEKSQSGVYHYLDAQTLAWKALLPAPSENGSQETQREIELILEKQKLRTSEAVARARADERRNPALFADVIGAWFTSENLPETFAFLKRIEEDSQKVSEKVKRLWARSRPSLQDSRVQPVINVPSSSSYPSGHALQGEVWAGILAEFAPDLKDRLLDRASQYGESRVIGGVHFPSDVAAGQTLGKTLVKLFLICPAYQAEFAQAKAEFDRAREKQLVNK